MKNTKKPFVFRGKYLLFAVLFAYIVVFIVNSDVALQGLSKSGAVLLKVLPILVIVIIFTALINYTLHPKAIVNHFGREGGMKGWLLALVAGVISHGPMYAWYPLIEDLRNQGLRDGLIATFYYARAIKIPLLPLMIDYFGLAFTLVLSLFILVGAFLQGVILEFLKWKKIVNFN